MIYLVVASMVCLGCQFETIGPYRTMQECEAARVDRTLAQEMPFGGCVFGGRPPLLKDIGRRW